MGENRYFLPDFLPASPAKREAPFVIATVGTTTVTTTVETTPNYLSQRWEQQQQQQWKQHPTS
jgi:hypothetical protein